MVSIRLSSRVDKFLVLWCDQQVRFLVPVIRDQGPLEPWFLLYSRLVFVLPATCTTTRLFGGARRRPHQRRAVQWHYWPFGSVRLRLETLPRLRVDRRVQEQSCRDQFEHLISLWRTQKHRGPFFLFVFEFWYVSWSVVWGVAICGRTSRR